MVYFGWPRYYTDPVFLPVGTSIRFTLMTRIVYGFSMFLCGIGAALQDRRRDVRFLAAVAAPWLLFFMILTQMHGRYSIWAAGILAILAGVNFGMATLGVIVSLISWMGIVENQLLISPNWSPRTLQTLQQVDPAPGWALLLIAGILLYVSLTRSGNAPHKCGR